MKLTKQTDYAFRILMFCAAGGSRLSRVADIAKAYGASEAFLFKILQRLVEGGTVETVRGRSGGIRLAKPAASITLADVVRLTEDNLSVADCDDNPESDCPLLENCRLTSALIEAKRAFFAVLERYTIDDLAKPSAAVVNLLTQLEVETAKAAPSTGT
ncbi:MAG: iron-responsive transcriptional regulator RirA [Pseudomonadota bacterium]